jgi:hypothetical protein
LILDWSGSDPINTVLSDLLHGNISDSAITIHSGPGAMGLGWKDAASQITIEPTLLGDVDLNGTVDNSDLGQLLKCLNKSGGWAQGDFNYNGMVDNSDLGAALANFNQPPVALALNLSLGSGGSSGGVSPVPAASVSAQPVAAGNIADSSGPASAVASPPSAVASSADDAQVGAGTLAAVKGTGQTAAATPAKMNPPIPTACDGDGDNFSVGPVAAAITPVVERAGTFSRDADANGSGTSGVPSQSPPTGQAAAQFLRDAVFSRWAAVGSARLSAQELLDTGDFEQDGSTDVLWYGPSDRSIDAQSHRKAAFGCSAVFKWA